MSDSIARRIQYMELGLRVLRLFPSSQFIAIADALCNTRVENQTYSVGKCLIESTLEMADVGGGRQLQILMLKREFELQHGNERDVWLNDDT